MRQIIKNEPSYFTTVKTKVKLPKTKEAWANEYINKIRFKLRSDMLLEEQMLLCAYCEKEIDESPKSSNIDHFKTRNLFPELTLEYKNLFVSCNHNAHCSSHKDRLPLTKEDYQNILNPLSEELEDVFGYTSFGEIEPLTQKAKFTQDSFNLNHISLVEERKLIIQNFENYREFDENILVECLGGHIGLIRELKKEKR